MGVLQADEQSNLSADELQRMVSLIARHEGRDARNGSSICPFSLATMIFKALPVLADASIKERFLVAPRVCRRRPTRPQRPRSRRGHEQWCPTRPLMAQPRV